MLSGNIAELTNVNKAEKLVKIIPEKNAREAIATLLNVNKVGKFS